MPIDPKFTLSPPGPSPTYDASSFFDGIGTRRFYCFVNYDASGLIYNMSPEQLPSTNINATSNIIPHLESDSGAKTNTSSAEVLSLTFTSEKFNTARIAQGTANVTLGFSSKISASDVNFLYYWVATIYKYDGVTQTSLGTTTIDELSTGTGLGAGGIITIRVDISRVGISINERLQLKIQCYAYKTSGTSYNIILGHDGLNRDGLRIIPSSSQYAQTKLTLDMPFKITG